MLLCVETTVPNFVSGHFHLVRGVLQSAGAHRRRAEDVHPVPQLKSLRLETSSKRICQTKPFFPANLFLQFRFSDDFLFLTQEFKAKLISARETKISVPALSDCFHFGGIFYNLFLLVIKALFIFFLSVRFSLWWTKKSFLDYFKLHLGNFTWFWPTKQSLLNSNLF